MRKIVLKATVLSSLLLLTLNGVRAASVGVGGYTNSFASQPAAADWSTFSLLGGAADNGTPALLDAAVTNGAAGSVNQQTGMDSANPAAAAGSAVWSSSGLCLQTRPTGNGAVLLMCTLINGLGGAASAVNISYDLARSLPVTEEVDGHRAYYSLTGAAGSWTVIPQLSTATPGRLTASLSIAWPNGGSLYLLWADDNGSGTPDTVYQIDNFSATATSAPQVPVAMTSQPQPQTVAELAPASFTVGVSGNPQPTFQWYKNDAPIGGATTATYQIAAALLSDSGAQFKVVAANTVSNVNHSVTSAPPALLTVNADTDRPVLLGATSSGLNQIVAQFSERLAAASVANVANYAVTGLTGNLTISNAVLDASQTNLLLSVSAMTQGATYTLTVNGVTDQSVAANRIATNSQAQFTAVSYTLTDIGAPAIAGSVSSVGNGFDVVAGGTNISGSSDQFSFNYRLFPNDFDVKVRVAGLGLSDTWARAGLMARESLNANSRFAASIATPSVAGVFFQARATAGAVATSSGSFPVNYPYTWLRLKRVGDIFTGYASVDGENWMQLGSATLAGAARPMSVGMAVVSANASQSTTAQFRDLQDVIGGTIGNVVLPVEPPGPSSRKTGLAITEIMYKPAPRGDDKILDFIEIYNSNPFYEDISGYKITGDVDFVFPPNTILKGGAYLVVAKAPGDIQSVYGITNVIGPYGTNPSGSNLTTQGTIRLRNKESAIYLEIPYSNQSPWPVAADGTGHSLVLARPSQGEGNPEAWAISDAVGGSPGRQDGVSGGPLRSVVINEFLANTDPPLVDYIELYNHANQPADISGCSLSDDARTNKFVVPTNTVIPARGFAVFYQPQLPFGLSSGGEIIYFRSADNTRILDAVQFEAQPNGVSSGRYPDGASDFYPLAAGTPGTTNSGILVNDVVINEIMYEPISGDNDDEYVELYNKGTSSVNLGGWRFVAGIKYTFPSNAVLGAGQYLVVARDVTNLLAHYPNLNTTNTFGSFDGSLANGGERLALGRPDLAVSTNSQGQVSTNVVYVVVDEVTYGVGGNWGIWANEGGSSLELIDPRSNHRLAHNWTDSDETAKAPWTTVQAFGALDNGAAAANLIEILALGEGEYLVDNVEVIQGTNGPNLLAAANSNFESGLGIWQSRGTHLRSSLETSGGFGGGQCLHVRASERGDSIVNRNTCTIPAPLGTVTIRAQVRWLKGWPEILFRLHGNWMEAYGRLKLPASPGTPGARNSVTVTNAPPAIYEVNHTPVLPGANEAVVVRARVHDPDGVSSLVLNYRIDPAVGYTPVTMVDDGTGGDAVAQDGIFSATIPGQVANTLVAFRVTATDSLGANRVFPLPLAGNYALPFECLVRFGDLVPFGAFGTYRQWLTASAVTAWANRAALSNEKVYGTFVNGNYRAIYNMTTRWNGSPYHQFGGAPGADGHYSIDLPLDDQMMGTASFHKIHMPGNGPGDDNTIQREQTCYWFARQLGLPWNYRRNVNMIFNGARRGGTTLMMEDTETPGADVLDSRFPDDADGDLYKLQPWFEQDVPTDPASRSVGGAGNQSWCLMNKFTTSSNGVPVYKTARYRNNYLVRAANGTANNYAPVFSMIDLAHTPTNGWTAHTSALDAIIDVEEWTRIWSVCHAVGDWDHFGTQNAQNMYGYKPRNGKWELMIWDMNIVLGNGSWGAGQNLIGTFTGTEDVIPGIYANPRFRRMYLRALKELANGPMLNANVDPVMDAKYAAFLTSGITPAAPSSGLKADILARRNAIVTTVAMEDTTNFVLTVTNMITTSNNLVTITGRAPVEMSTLAVNGLGYPVVWTTVRNWTLSIAVSEATNVLNLQGYDLRGNPLAGFGATVTVRYTGPAPDPENAIVFNEIMHAPPIPGAQFVEIYNRTNLAFDLTGWRINGLDYEFPGGSVLAPRQFLVLAKDRGAYTAAYGTNTSPFAQFDGNLDADGETLTLLKPGTNGAPDRVIDKVRYEARLPWAAGANGGGAALQLVDPAQDNSRPSNWSDRQGWQQVIYTGTISGGATLGTNLAIFVFGGAGDYYIDDFVLVTGAVANVGANLVLNGDFESPLSGPWSAQGNHNGSVISTDVFHSGSGSLHVIATASGGPAAAVRQMIPAFATNTVCTASYWFRPGASGAQSQVRTFSGSSFSSVVSLRPANFTPGAANNDQRSLPPYDPLWLNELQASNTAGITDNFGDRDPWVEIYNGGPNPLSLDGYFLAANYDGDLQQWPFPNGVTIGPRQFKLVWLDGEPQETVGVTDLHANFRLNDTTGSVALVRTAAGGPQITDYLTYSGLGAGLSYGDYPDGQPFVRRIFQSVTPSGTNISRGVNLFINEWMASNTTNSMFFDLVDGDFNDWFELYNAGGEPVDLSGYYLTDNLGDATKYQVPTNSHYIIPAGGFLLVWADAEPEQNNPDLQDLHVSFRLSGFQGSIGLFAPDGESQIDAISYGQQTNDVSQGRCADGAAPPFYFFHPGQQDPSPRGANHCGVNNFAPTLAPIGDRIVRVDETLNFNALATDPEAPPQTLSFSLTNAPAGATIGAVNGIFTWTPTAAQANTTNHVTVSVMDSGTPPKSDSETIVIVALPRPQAGIINNAGNLSISFDTIPGRAYRVEFKTNLDDDLWTPLTQSTPATDTTMIVPDTIGAETQRFYRIVETN